MSTVILLDTGVLGLITYSRVSLEGAQCKQWLVSMSAKGFDMRVPEIADYELRRELLRMNKVKAIKHLEDFGNTLGYIPLTRETMRRAAQFWAEVRKKGKPTASDAALDGDVILAAQASVIESRGYDVVVATTNVKHLSLFINAKDWKDML